ncbi:MAG TPA: hypothetical protein PLX35_05325 [Cyclobacteriaceae bacterium]|nr:hypothetical protein [Cyclobacteriaceae bacterium]
MRIVVKYALLLIAYSLAFVLPAILLPVSAPLQESGNNMALGLPAVLAVNFLIILYLIHRSASHGIKLCFYTMLIFWGLQTGMTQIETWYFRHAMPGIDDRELLNLFIRPLITLVIFVPMAVRATGKWKGTHEPRPQMVAPWKSIGILVLLYVVIYFVFGYYVAWQFDALRIFYSGSATKAGFIEVLRHTAETTPGLFPLQLLRGLLYAMMGVMLLRQLNGSYSEKLIAITLLYALLPSILLILSNPFMPPDVRMGHLIELTISNGLFGSLIGVAGVRQQLIQ